MTSMYRATLFNDDSEIATFKKSTQSDVVLDVVEFLIEQYDLPEKVSPLPFSPGRFKRSLLNTEAFYPDGEREMVRCRRTDSGYYVDTLASAEDKKSQLERLVEECDISIRFSGDW